MLKKEDIQHQMVLGVEKYFYSSYMFGGQILTKLLSDNTACLDMVRIYGSLKKSVEKLCKCLEDNGARKIVKENSRYVYVWPNYSTVGFSFNKKEQTIDLMFYVLEPEAQKCADIIKKNFISKKKKDLVYAIVQDSNGIRTELVGQGGSPLIKDNYNDDVIEKYDYILKEFKKESPSGRIAILDGPAGSGKTHLIRSMFGKIDAVFLIIPSNLLSSLDGPQFLPLLLKLKNDENKKPVILVIEDGDAILLPRKNDNMSSIASLLNLSDGILGSVIDIRLIISTNATIKEMDQAILRPGRLCKQVSVNALEYEKANKVFHRIKKSDQEDLPNQKFYTLAEIYQCVNQNNITPAINTATPKRVIGFHQNVEQNEAFTINKVENAIGFHK